MSVEIESGWMQPPVTPREVVDALDVVRRWYREDTTGENWRVDIQQMDSDRESMARLVWPELNDTHEQDEGPPVSSEAGESPWDAYVNQAKDKP